jgi:hypothetical protein
MIMSELTVIRPRLEYQLLIAEAPPDPWHWNQWGSDRVRKQMEVYLFAAERQDGNSGQ